MHWSSPQATYGRDQLYGEAVLCAWGWPVLPNFLTLHMLWMVRVLCYKLLCSLILDSRTPHIPTPLLRCLFLEAP